MDCKLIQQTTAYMRLYIPDGHEPNLHEYPIILVVQILCRDTDVILAGNGNE